MRYFGITRFASVKATAGRRVSVTWPVLAAMVTTPGHAASKLSAPGWSPATFSGTRANANVVEVGALVLDYDGGVSISDVEVAVSGLAAAWHTSWSHTEANPRFRLVVNVSRSMTPDEFVRVWAWGFERFRSGTGRADPSCKDVSRPWVLPVQRTVETFASKALAGAPLDVDHVLSIAPPVPLGPGRRHARHVLNDRPTASGILPPQVEALVRSTLAVEQLWKGEKATGDTSRSGCDYAFVRELLRRGVPAEDAMTALRLRPDVHSTREDYIVRTVSNALAALRRPS